MKQKMSFFSMIVRATLSRVLWILGVLVVLNLGLFALQDSELALYNTIDQPVFAGLMLLALVILWVVLGSAFRDRGGHQNYALGRLRCSRRWMFWNQAACNSLYLLLFFLTETVVLLGMCGIAWLREPEIFNNQTLMVTCYGSNLLHIFLPLSDVAGWISNLGISLCLGICLAAMSYQNRQSMPAMSGIFAGIAALISLLNQWNAGMDFLDGKIILLVIMAVITGVAVVLVYSGEVDERD